MTREAVQNHPEPVRTTEGAWDRMVLRDKGNSEHACGRIEGDPGASGNSQPGSDQHPFATEGDGVALPILESDADTTRDELRDHVISLLDAVRHQYESALHSYESARANRIYYIRLARQHGMTNADVGEILGMTEAGIRMAVKRADTACCGRLKPQHYCAECGRYNPDEEV